MKTTIEIPDALAAEAKALAHREGSTLRDLVVTGLRSELDRRRETPKADFVFPTFAGHGLAVEVSAADAISRSYGLPG